MYYVTVTVYYRKKEFQNINPYIGPSLINWDLEELYHFETAYVPEIGEILMIDKLIDNNDNNDNNVQDKSQFEEKPFVVKEKIRLDSTNFAVIVEDYIGFEFEVVNGLVTKKEIPKLN